MIKTTIPLERFEEISKHDACTFFARFDKNIVEDMVECTEIGVKIDGAPNYSKLVAALITERYDYDTQIAMLANKNDGDPEHAAAWDEFQNWRTEAKRLARIMFPNAAATDEE